MDDAKPIIDVVDDAPEYRESLDDAVKRLAALTDGEYEQVRNSEAKKLDVRAKYLDGAVSAARGNGKADGGLNLYEPEPWDEPVDGDDLLDRMVAAIREYVVTPEHVAEAVALWTIHAHAFELWEVTPRLAISAPTMNSGKSLLQDVIACMVPRALEADNLSSAVMFRAVETYRPCLMVDEVDTYLKKNEELHGILNSGHSKGGQVLRCEGDNHNLKVFRTFAPVTTAGIGRLTDRGTEYCGRADRHDYQLFLAINDIEHTKTKVRSPQTNGICERFHKTILQEFYQITFRKKIYDSTDMLQIDLGADPDN